ncbi:MAG TPA: bifunctional hydroxymethylpyrimidine kinase/phosphomethylpyrimidine kinase [Rhizomicrobium sp.]|nr:bifunctional hydroxymethylpyrimidine kinase/phosphomethylpyrimidine kinase [Rhizomicrobium sp.]
MTPGPPRLLIIAGSDSGGGAGIQADIKTATAFGVYAMTAITAVTVQDTLRVHAVHPVPASIVRDQIACVGDDIGADAVKIGMLGSKEIVQAVAAALQDFAPIPIVLDPVLASTSGTQLLAADSIDIMTSRLFPLAALVTPNIPETERLAGMQVEDETQIVAAARRLREFGARAVLVKGGHAEGERIRDILVTGSGAEIFEAPRIAARSTHGTGCTLSTAIACGLANKLPLRDSVIAARAFVQAAIVAAPGFGRGNGPLNHLHGAVPGRVVIKHNP